MRCLRPGLRPGLWHGLWPAAATLVLAGCAPRLARFEFPQDHMGTTFTLVMYAPDQRSAHAAAEQAFARVSELNSILSDYDPESELSRLSRSSGSGHAVTLSEPLWRVLSESVELSKRSGGAFDVTIGPYKQLWRQSRALKSLPAARRLDAARAAVGYQHIQLDPATRSATLLVPGMRLDLGAIAKGYAADEALAVLRRHGIERAMIDAGGDVVLGKAPPERAGWRIGLAPLDPAGKPSLYLIAQNLAIATSGDAFQFVEIDGKRYSHLIDPKTGLGRTDHSTVSVIAPDGITADSLASAVSVLGPEAGMKLIEQTPAAAACIVRIIDGKVEEQHSRRFNQLKIEQAPTTPSLKAAPGVGRGEGRTRMFATRPLTGRPHRHPLPGGEGVACRGVAR